MPPRDLSAWMWAEACEALTRAERMHRQFFRLAADRLPVWEPPIDVFETEGELWIVAALPGVAARRIEIAIDHGILVIAGERPPLAAQRAAAIPRLELPQGRFERRVALPVGRFEMAQRTIDDGCLTLVLRKLG
jgi:HSP20 family molecular chaperone IbpA